MSILSIPKAFRKVTSSRGKPWDDREIQVFEAFKFFMFAGGTFTYSANFLMCTQNTNPWMILNFFKETIFSVVISFNVAMEMFVAISAFFFSYRLFQLHKSKGSLTFSDICKAWARKYLKIAPVLYCVFFMAWALFPRMGAGPIWYDGAMMFETCKTTWWAQVLFISNIYPYF